MLSQSLFVLISAEKKLHSIIGIALIGMDIRLNIHLTQLSGTSVLKVVVSLRELHLFTT